MRDKFAGKQRGIGSKKARKQEGRKPLRQAQK